jgi:hypothetical protein
MRVSIGLVMRELLTTERDWVWLGTLCTVARCPAAMVPVRELYARAKPARESERAMVRVGGVVRPVRGKTLLAVLNEPGRAVATSP